MNNIDKQYQTLLQSIIDFGVEKKDRTGTGTKSIFGYTIRHKMSEGFPLLTTKKMAWKTMVVELLWFLRGDTNIKFLLDYDCHIWDGDVYKNYLQNSSTFSDGMYDGKYLSKEELIYHIKHNEDWAKKWGELGPIYGKQWRSWGGRNIVNYDLENVKSSDKEKVMEQIINGGFIDGKHDIKVTYQNNSIDQIQNLINDLKINPDSRRLMVSAWNVEDLDQMVLPPCHYGFQVYTRELSNEEIAFEANKKGFNLKGMTVMGKLLIDPKEVKEHNLPVRAISLMWNQRSVDTFLGLPFNIGSYGLLLEIIAKEVNMVPDELIGNLGDVHLYKNHIEQAKEQIGRTPYELPKIQITERNWYMHEAVKKHLGEKTLDEKLKSYRPDCFELIDYQCHPKIKASLSN